MCGRWDFSVSHSNFPNVSSVQGWMRRAQQCLARIQRISCHWPQRGLPESCQVQPFRILRWLSGTSWCLGVFSSPLLQMVHQPVGIWAQTFQDPKRWSGFICRVFLHMRGRFHYAQCLLQEIQEGLIVYGRTQFSVPCSQ